MMEEKVPITSNCSFADVRPIMMDLPYPPIQIKERNPAYANLLSVDYCGSVSEMSAIMQYINSENRLVCDKCSMAKTILGIAMSEMIHLQKLGEMITLLGGKVDFTVRQNNGRKWTWTPECLTLSEHANKMLLDGIEAEKSAINQYRVHMKMINDSGVNAVLARIIRDEEYHIMLLQVLIKQL